MVFDLAGWLRADQGQGRKDGKQTSRALKTAHQLTPKSSQTRESQQYGRPFWAPLAANNEVPKGPPEASLSQWEATKEHPKEHSKEHTKEHAKEHVKDKDHKEDPAKK